MDHRLECGMGFVSRNGNTLELFEFAQVGLDAEVTLLGFWIDGQRVRASRVLGNADQSPSFVHRRDDPRAVAHLVRRPAVNCNAIRRKGASITSNLVPVIRGRRCQAHAPASAQIAHGCQSPPLPSHGLHANHERGQRQYFVTQPAIDLPFRVTLSFLLAGKRCLQR